MTFFAVKHPVVHFMSLPFLLFKLACDFIFTPSFRLCLFCVSCMDKNKKEKVPWLKSKKKTGPKKKKVLDEGWRKTLAETDKGSWFNKPSLDKLGIRRR